MTIRETAEQVLTELEHDITHFNLMEFSILENKFRRDYNLIKQLLENLQTEGE